MGRALAGPVPAAGSAFQYARCHIRAQLDYERRICDSRTQMRATMPIGTMGPRPGRPSVRSVLLVSG